jgi:AraC family transcriptional activator of pobA
LQAVMLLTLNCMKQAPGAPHIISSISELHRLMLLPKPDHPLVSIINFADVTYSYSDVWKHFMLNFYCIAIKNGCNGKMRYGQNDYDFDEGVMTFTAPGQVMSVSEKDGNPTTGYWLILHPDFLRNYPIGKTINGFGYFSYAVSEALHLSAKEETIVELIMKNIEDEYRSVIDTYSQDVIISHIELLLNYSNRFYNRQFLTRKSASNQLLVRVDTILSDYFNNKTTEQNGLPTVQFISEQLHLSPNYLSDMLRSLTGQNTQQHIHNHLIEKAKEILTSTSLSVSEIAYQLGFEYPQSFNKLFKSKTNLSPLAFRKSYN